MINSPYLKKEVKELIFKIKEKIKSVEKPGENFIIRPTLESFDRDFSEKYLINIDIPQRGWSIGLINTMSYIEFDKDINPEEYFTKECLEEVCDALRNKEVKTFKDRSIFYVVDDITYKR